MTIFGFLFEEKSGTFDQFWPRIRQSGLLPVHKIENIHGPLQFRSGRGARPTPICVGRGVRTPFLLKATHTSLVGQHQACPNYQYGCAPTCGRMHVRMHGGVLAATYCLRTPGMHTISRKSYCCLLPAGPQPVQNDHMHPLSPGCSVSLVLSSGRGSVSKNPPSSLPPCGVV